MNDINFTGFSGCDINVLAGHDVLAEAQLIEYTESLVDGTVAGTIVAAVFHSGDAVRKLLTGADTLTVKYYNEQGFWREEVIDGVEFKEVTKSRSVDDIVVCDIYHFTGKSVAATGGHNPITDGLTFDVDVTTPEGLKG